MWLQAIISSAMLPNEDGATGIWRILFAASTLSFDTSKSAWASPLNCTCPKANEKNEKKKKSKSLRFAHIKSKLYKTINKQQPKKQPKKMPHFAFRAPSIFFWLCQEKKKSNPNSNSSQSNPTQNINHTISNTFQSHKVFVFKIKIPFFVFPNLLY